MRYLSTFPTLLINSGFGNEVQNIHEVKPIESKHPHSALFTQIENYRRHAQHYSQNQAIGETDASRRNREERRKVSQRIRRDPILVELRSGIDRRRRHMRATDTVVHIDEEV